MCWVWANYTTELKIYNECIDIKILQNYRLVSDYLFLLQPPILATISMISELVYVPIYDEECFIHLDRLLFFFWFINANACL